MNKQSQKGFTLIEILVVIGMIAILATVVLIAINPARQFAQGRNSQRTSNVNAILNAIGQYVADNKGDLPPSVAALAVNTPTQIGDGIGQVDLCTDLISTYIPLLPTDPDSTHEGEGLTQADCTAGYDTDYDVSRDSDSRITIKAPNTELCSATPCAVGDQIKVIR